MATAKIVLTARDYEMFRALGRCPLTVRQLRILSTTFLVGFGSDRRLQDRLAHLVRAELLRRFRYAALCGSGEYYYTLTPESFQVIHGNDAALPGQGAFREVGIARHYHTHSLADFIVHTAVAAHQARLALTGFCRENSFSLTVGDETLYPDCGFQLITLAGQEFSFFVELDNSTERIRSQKHIDSWERKIRLYDAFLDRSPKRFRVLILTTRSDERLQHILSAAKEIMRNPERALFYGVSLRAYVATPDAVTAACFQDHHGKPKALVLPHRVSAVPARRNHPPLSAACYAAIPAPAMDSPV